MDLARAWRRLQPWVGVALLAAAAYVLVRVLRKTPPREILAAVQALSPSQLLGSLALVAVCYLLFTLYDALAWRNLRETRPYGELARASFVGYGLAHTLGASLVVGGLARERIQGPRGVRHEQVLAVVVFCGLTSFLGYLALSAPALLLWPEAGALHGLGVPAVRAGGLAALLLVAAYLGASAAGVRALRWRGRAVRVPRPRVALAQTGVGGLEWLLSALALAPLLPADYPLPALLVGYVLAKAAAFVVHTPGGIGVFEATLLALAPATAGDAQVLGALLVYRTLFYLAPFVLAALLLGANELRGRRPRHPRDDAMKRGSEGNGWSGSRVSLAPHHRHADTQTRREP